MQGSVALTPTLSLGEREHCGYGLLVFWIPAFAGMARRWDGLVETKRL